MDYVPEEEKERSKIIKKAWFFQKLGLLSVFKKPTIMFKGLKGLLIKWSSYIIHFLLKLCFINHIKCYKKADALMSNNKESTVVAYAYDTLPSMLVFKLDEIFPLIKMPFGDTYIYLPKEYHKMLTDYFGDYMQLPPLEDRKNHYPKILDFGDYK